MAMPQEVAFKSRKLWIGDLPTTTSEPELKAFFGRFGWVESVVFFPSRGYAVVAFHNVEEAMAAKATLDGDVKIEFEVDIDKMTGFKFLPTDKELVGEFLYNRVCRNSTSNDNIKECDLYGEKEPWEIWETYGGDCVPGKREDRCLYFFTRLKKKSEKSRRYERKVGKGGTWKGEDAGSEVTVKETNVVIKGLKKRYKYEGGPKEQQGLWSMVEVSLISVTSDIVLCRIRKHVRNEDKNNVADRKRKLQQVDEAYDEDDEKCSEPSKRTCRDIVDHNSNIICEAETAPTVVTGIGNDEIVRWCEELLLLETVEAAGADQSQTSYGGNCSQLNNFGASGDHQLPPPASSIEQEHVCNIVGNLGNDQNQSGFGAAGPQEPLFTDGDFVNIEDGERISIEDYFLKDLGLEGFSDSPGLPAVHHDAQVHNFGMGLELPGQY